MEHAVIISNLRTRWFTCYLPPTISQLPDCLWLDPWVNGFGGRPECEFFSTHTNGLSRDAFLMRHIERKPLPAIGVFFSHWFCCYFFLFIQMLLHWFCILPHIFYIFHKMLVRPNTDHRRSSPLHTERRLLACLLAIWVIKDMHVHGKIRDDNWRHHKLTEKRLEIYMKLGCRWTFSPFASIFPLSRPPLKSFFNDFRKHEKLLVRQCGRVWCKVE